MTVQETAFDNDLSFIEALIVPESMHSGMFWARYSTIHQTKNFLLQQHFGSVRPPIVSWRIERFLWRVFERLSDDNLTWPQQRSQETYKVLTHALFTVDLPQPHFVMRGMAWLCTVCLQTQWWAVRHTLFEATAVCAACQLIAAPQNNGSDAF